MGPAEAGFWPVMRMPSAMTFGPHSWSALTYLPPSSVILSSSRKGMSCRWSKHQVVANAVCHTHFDLIDLNLLGVGEAGELTSFEDGYAVLVNGANKCAA